MHLWWVTIVHTIQPSAAQSIRFRACLQEDVHKAMVKLLVYFLCKTL